MKIYTISTFNWQSPVITEKHAYELIKDDPEFSKLNLVYLAIPWATLIDKFNKAVKKDASISLNVFLEEAMGNEILLDQNIKFTVCQSIYYYKLLAFFKKLNIKYLFSPHVVKNNFKSIKSTYEIEGMPFPLYPINAVDPGDNKEYLYSFIGNINYETNEAYGRLSSEIRHSIVNRIDHPPNTVIEPLNSWHFDELVYKEQIYEKRLNVIDKHQINQRTSRYRNVISKSRFSLCPRGTGPSSIRFWESLGSGAIPVVISDDFWLPSAGSFDWEDAVVFIKESEFMSVPEVLLSISFEKENTLRINSIKAFKSFTGSNFISTIKAKFLSK